jgi:hypothetical protein
VAELHREPSEACPAGRASWQSGHTVRSRLQALRDRANLPVLIAGSCVIIVLCNAYALSRGVRGEREKAIANTLRDNSNLVIAFEQYVTRTIAIADAVTHLVRREVDRGGLYLDFAWLADKQAFDSDLVSTASVIDAKGQLVGSSSSSGLSDEAKVTSAAELAFHAAHETDVIRIGMPAPQISAEER